MKTIEITIYRSSGRPQKIKAKLLRVAGDEASLETGVAIDVGSAVVLSDEDFARTSFTVLNCSITEDGLFNIGIGKASDTEQKSEPEFVDYYETLQVNPNATDDTISRVFRIMAQRHHPDNTDTGDVEMFRLVTEAYRILSDPIKRAAYDLRRDSAISMRWKLFETAEESVGVEAERSKRHGILGLLYNRRLAEPRKPGMTIRSVEQLLHIPMEHLDNPIWYLVQKRWVTQGDGGSLELTIQGVDEYENSETEKIREMLMIEQGDGSEDGEVVRYAGAGNGVAH